MNILLDFNPSTTDLYFCYGIVAIIVLFYLFSGVIILADKNTKMISSNGLYTNQKLFTMLYGLADIIFCVALIVLSVLGLVFINSSMPFLIADLFVLIGLWITQFVLQKVFKI